MALRFRVTLEDGTVAESNFDEPEPLELHVGDGTFPEPLAFSYRAYRELKTRAHEFDLVGKKLNNQIDNEPNAIS